MKIRPLRGYVFIEPLKEEEKTSVGVYLPETAKDKPMKGKVLMVGNLTLEQEKYVVEAKMFPAPDVTTETIMKLKKGQIVYYKKWQNSELQIEGKDYVFVEFKDLLGVEDDDK